MALNPELLENSTQTTHKFETLSFQKSPKLHREEDQGKIASRARHGWWAGADREQRCGGAHLVDDEHDERDNEEERGEPHEHHLSPTRSPAGAALSLREASPEP